MKFIKGQKVYISESSRYFRNQQPIKNNLKVVGTITFISNSTSKYKYRVSFLSHGTENIYREEDLILAHAILYNIY